MIRFSASALFLALIAGPLVAEEEPARPDTPTALSAPSAPGAGSLPTAAPLDDAAPVAADPGPSPAMETGLPLAPITPTGVPDEFIVEIEAGTDPAALGRAWAVIEAEITASPSGGFLKVRVARGLLTEDVIALMEATRGVARVTRNASAELFSLPAD